MNRFTMRGTNESRTPWREATDPNQAGAARRTFLRSMSLMGMVGFAGCIHDTIVPDDEPDVGAPEPMTLIVDVPTNTFEEDIVLIPIRMEKDPVFGHREPVFKQMEKVDDYSFRVELTAEEVDFDLGSIFNYVYFRGNLPHGQGEVIPADVWEEPWGRNLVFEEGTVQRDVVEQWEWFPVGPLPEADLTDLTMPYTFQDRVDEEEFRLSVWLPDLYEPYHELFYEPTAKRLREAGANWVTLGPPWQWIEEDPPRFGDVLALGLHDLPNYPLEMLRSQIQVFKEEGFKVNILPQLMQPTQRGEDPINFEDKDEDWWGEYYNELEKFYLHFAWIAEEEGADAIHVYANPDELEWGIDVEANWRSVVANLRDEFSGEIGLSVDPGSDESQLTFGDEFDIFLVEWKSAMLSPNDDPSIVELVNAAGDEFDGFKWLYDSFGKPVTMWEVFHSAKQSWKGDGYWPEVMGMNYPELWEEDEHDIFSGMDQAIAIHAVMRAIEDRPWIVGLDHQEYGLVATPLHPSWDIRGRPAEELLREWSKVIYGEGAG